MATIEDFHKVDIRVGKIILGVVHPVKLRQSRTRFAGFNRVNFPPRQIGKFMSEVLTLGVPDKDDNCVLIVPEKDTAEVGGRLF